MTGEGLGAAAPLSRGSVERVLLVVDGTKQDALGLVEELRGWLRERVGQVEELPDLGGFLSGQLAPALHPDLAVVLGGDGMLLAVARVFAPKPVPIVGINFGRVGFLASTPAGHWRETLESVLEGHGRLEQRMRLCLAWERDGVERREIALNEMLVQRGSHQGMLTVTLRVGEDWLTNYRADGLIVATPSGSTAYSLSAGGPILAPSVNALVVTPVCSQGLSNRPIVLPEESQLLVGVKAASGVTTLAIDGQSYHPLSAGECVRVTRHPVRYPVYAMPGLDPYRRLRSRLGWRGSVEPDEFGDFGAGLGAGASDPLPPGGSEGGRY